MPKIVWNVPVRMTVTFVRQVALPKGSTVEQAIEAASEDLGWDNSNFEESNLFFDSTAVGHITNVKCVEEIGKYSSHPTPKLDPVEDAAPTLAGDDHEFDEDELSDEDPE